MDGWLEHRLPAETDTAADGGGVFGGIGRFVVRWPWLVIGAWIALAIGVTMAFPPLAVLAQRAPASILPANAPSVVSQKQMSEAFARGQLREHPSGRADQ